MFYFVHQTYMQIDLAHVPSCMCRYELPQPAAGQKNDFNAWQDAVNNSCAQLEHQAGR